MLSNQAMRPWLLRQQVTQQDKNAYITLIKKRIDLFVFLDSSGQSGFLGLISEVFHQF